jgi:hypothetical protein
MTVMRVRLAQLQIGGQHFECLVDCLLRLHGSKARIGDRDATHTSEGTPGPIEAELASERSLMLTVYVTWAFLPSL